MSQAAQPQDAKRRGRRRGLTFILGPWEVWPLGVVFVGSYRVHRFCGAPMPPTHATHGTFSTFASRATGGRIFLGPEGLWSLPPFPSGLPVGVFAFCSGSVCSSPMVPALSCLAWAYLGAEFYGIAKQVRDCRTLTPPPTRSTLHLASAMQVDSGRD